MLGNACGPMLAGLVASLHLDWVFLGDGILYGVLGLLVYQRIGRPRREPASTSKPEMINHLFQQFLSLKD